jgi:abortive infection alpha-like protein
MTGGEVVAGKAAKALAERVLKADDDEKRQLLDLAKDSAALEAAADAYAKRVAVKQQILLRLYRPLARLIGISKAYFDDQFAKELAEHVGDIPEENLISPPGNIALPAMQGLAFSLEEPNLKAMYLKLLASASDSRRPYDSHPSFAQIIRELSSDEARLLQGLLGLDSLPIARIKLVTGGNTWQPIRHHVLNWAEPDTPIEALIARCAYVDNWIRLGLIDVSYDMQVSGDGDSDPYAWVTGRPEYPPAPDPADPVEEGPPRFQPTVSFDRGVLRVTDFGKRFLRAIS